MTRTTRLSALALLLTLYATPSRADTIFAGAGTATCGVFAKNYKEAPLVAEELYYYWAQGFMSGLNANGIQAKGQAHDLLAITEDQQKFFLRSYCNDHPLSDFAQAVIALYGSLKLAAPLKNSN